ncbi:MAG: HAMP domain-containing histidine kinase [Anaerolineae bacterium]|nr:HAMP domain-containing histidine kinase [Anaerolineae bacterium]
MTTQSDTATSGPPRGLQPTFEELCHNTQLLIRLRWIAGFGILLGAAFAHWVMGIDLKIVRLLAIGVVVLVYNTVLLVIANSEERTLGLIQHIAWGQIILDWLAMLALVHFTGGVTSPALPYFFVHAALSGTILVPWQTRSLALLAIAIVAGLAWLESTGTLSHFTIDDLHVGTDLYKNDNYILGVLFFFGTTVFTLSELVARNAQRIRQREEHIRQLYDARETFVRVATHELRAPLGASLSLMRNIEQGYAGELSDQQHAILTRVTSRLEGLHTLVDDLLTLARSREAITAHAPLIPDSVRETLNKIIDRERPHVERKQIVLDCQMDDEPGIVMSGNVGLQIIFGNLINNAVKYTPDGGDVQITYQIDMPHQTAEITIADSGIGIPASDLPRIFNEFFRAQNAKQSQIIGTGIGLATVKTLVERYNGTIDLASKEGKGTTVHVSLPLAPKQTRLDHPPH